MNNETRLVQLTANSHDPKAFAEAVSEAHFKIRDFVTDTRDVNMFTDKDGSMISLRGIGANDAEGEFAPESFTVNPWAHNQLADFCGIPQAYYRRMQDEQHGLLDTSVRTWLDAAGGKRRMVRTLDGKVRAFLSDRYRRIDNYHVANTVLPVLAEAGATFRRLHVTEDSMVIQAVFTEKKADVTLGDTIMLGVTIENNEVGRGNVSIMPMSLRLVCMNGMTHNEFGHKRQHVGTRLGGDGDPSEFYADDTLQASDQALMLQLRDVTRKACSDALLESLVADMQRAQGVAITTQPVHAVAELANRTGLNEAEGAGVLSHLLAGGTMTQYAMVQAITRHAQDVADGTRGHELEVIGGNILALAAAEFAPIATAGAPKPTRRRR